MKEINFMGQKYPLLNLSYAFNSKRIKHRNRIIVSELLTIALILILIHSADTLTFGLLFGLNFIIHFFVFKRFQVWEVILVYINENKYHHIPMVNFRDKEEAVKLTEAIQSGIKTGNFPDFLIQQIIIK